MSADLLPCPFCGDETIMSDWDCRGDGADQFPQDVVCMGCGIGFCGQDAKGKGNAFVAELWNRRAAAPVPPAQAPVEPMPMDGWLRADSLLYRLNGKGVICDEIDVRMIFGDRGMTTRANAAAELLSVITCPDQTVALGNISKASFHALMRGDSVCTTITKHIAFSDDMPLYAAPVAQPAAANKKQSEEVVTALYRRFKDWSKRGFGPDDVTWCEVKADVESLIALHISSAQPAAPVADLTDAQKAAPELLAALQAILPFVPVSSAKDGGAVKYSANVAAADAVRAALATGSQS
jgi:predicted RNA-binding Zn-ribbon protein involved in translation (DUF1610 family)